MGDKLAAALHGSGPCKKSCCWNPWGTCSRQWTCDHHRDHAHKEAAAESWQEVQEQSLRRAERLSKAESKRMSEWSHWR